MKGTGMFVTKEELERVQVAQKCSGMFLPGGQPMSDPVRLVNDLDTKYDPPKGSGLNTETGEFCLP